MALETFSPAAADLRFSQHSGSEDVIPEGMYCYSRSSIVENSDTRTLIPCPYWGMDSTRRSQENGYCAYLKSGDWSDDGVSLLWDQVKECRVNDHIEDDE